MVKKELILKVKRDLVEKEILEIIKTNLEIEKFLKRPSNKKINICTQQTYKYYTIKNVPKKNYTSSFVVTIILWV